jgi:hypothetical protein
MTTGHLLEEYPFRSMPTPTAIENRDFINYTNVGAALLQIEYDSITMGTWLSDPTAMKWRVISVTTNYDLALEAALANETRIEATKARPFAWLYAIITTFSHGYTITHAGSTAHSTRISPTSRRDQALEATEDLISWLGLTYDDIARIAKVAKGTIFNWRRTGAEPRPHTVRRLLQVHTLLELVARRLGIQGVRRWVRSGSPSPLELLLQGDLEAAERIAYRDFFRQRELRMGEMGGFQEDEDTFVLPEAETVDRGHSPPRRTARAPTRKRLTGS